MNQHFYRLALAALFTGTIWSLHKQAENKRRRAIIPGVKPEAVQTWEDEGGALPLTGSHMGPNPTRP